MTDTLATLTCQRGKPKRELCPCPPCSARRRIFGSNIPVQEQEDMRAKVMRLETELVKARQAFQMPVGTRFVRIQYSIDGVNWCNGMALEYT